MAKKKILLVDDELDFLKIMGMWIEEWGYDLIKATSGKEAIDALESEKPDVIILDYLMPDMDGLTTLKEIRKLNEKIPAIMLTAHPDIKVQKDTGKLGISAFVAKLSPLSDVHYILKTCLDSIEKKQNKEK